MYGQAGSHIKQKTFHVWGGRKTLPVTANLRRGMILRRGLRLEATRSAVEAGTADSVVEGPKETTNRR